LKRRAWRPAKPRPRVVRIAEEAPDFRPPIGARAKHGHCRAAKEPEDRTHDVTNRRLNPGAYVERLSANVWHGRGAKKSLDHVADVDKIARLPPARQLDGVTVRGAVDHIGDKPM